MYKTSFNTKFDIAIIPINEKYLENIPNTINLWLFVVKLFYFNFSIFKVDIGVEWPIPLCPWLTESGKRKNCRGSFHEACSSGTVYLPTWRPLWGPRGLWASLHWRRKIDGGICRVILLNIQSHSREATGSVTGTPFDKYAESLSRNDWYSYPVW